MSANCVNGRLAITGWFTADQAITAQSQSKLCWQKAKLHQPCPVVQSFVVKFCSRTLLSTKRETHWWLNFFCPILQHFCPLLVQFAQMGLILPIWGLILPRILSQTPVLYSAVTNPFQGMYEQDTPSPTPKYPFSWPDSESGQNELLSGQNGPSLGKMFEKWAKLF